MFFQYFVNIHPDIAARFLQVSTVELDAFEKLIPLASSDAGGAWCCLAAFVHGSETGLVLGRGAAFDVR